MSNARNLANLLGTSTTIAQDKISSDVSFGVSSYNNISTLPLSGNDIGDQAFVDSDNRLYIWNGSGWYNIALINTSPSITGGYESSYVFETDGTPIEITLVGSDPEGIPLTWSYEVTSGSLTNGGGTTATVSNVDNVFTITPSTTEDYSGSFSLTFKASDGVNLGTAVSSFTLQFKIVNSNYTTLLAKGTAATQNATFVDSSTNAHTITRNGDVYQGTFSPYRGGGYSMYFDGTGDYLAVPNDTSLQLGNSEFTIEAWIYPTAIDSGGVSVIMGKYSPPPNLEWFLGITSSAIRIRYSVNGSSVVGNIDASYAVSFNTWTHIAVSRVGNNLKFFADGVQIGSDVAFSSTFYQGTGAFEISNANDDDSTRFIGYISNPRVVKGTAVYTSNFTPPTEPLTAITNTSLLINTPYIADSSTNAHAITVNGNTSTQPFSPFDYKVYDEAVNGGSAYLAGTGVDYLSIPASLQFLPGENTDFTFEVWVYLTVTPGAQGAQIVGTGEYGINSDWSIRINSSRIPLFYINLPFTVSSDTAINLNEWNHIAVSRSGTETNNLKLFLNGILVGQASTNVSLDRNGNNLTIGADANGDESIFTGYTSDIRLVNGTALYTTDFTPPTTPLTAITNTSLLLNFTNAGVQDYSQVSNLKLLGNATGSNTQTKNASYSMYFAADGTDKVSVLDTAPIHALGVGDFTIEFWVYIVSNNTYNFVVSKGSGGSSREWAVDVGPTNIRFYYTLNGSTDNEYSVTPSSIPTNTWMHIAVCNSGSSLRIFKDGSQVGTTGSLSGTVYVGSGPLELANFMGYSGIAHSLNGYIEDLRITKGLARYTANFTPPTTELLG